MHQISLGAKSVADRGRTFWLSGTSPRTLHPLAILQRLNASMIKILIYSVLSQDHFRGAPDSVQRQGCARLQPC